MFLLGCTVDALSNRCAKPSRQSAGTDNFVLAYLVLTAVALSVVFFS
jgi:hypothetical protein